MSAFKETGSKKPDAYATRQKGFTLIELMISMVLGIVVITAMLVMYTSGNAAMRNAEAQSQMNEDAQMALSVITYELRQAGFNPTLAGGGKNDLIQSGWTLFGCDTGFTSNTTAAVNALACNASGSSASVATVSEGDLYSGKNTTTGKPMDCIGNGISITGAYYIKQSRLFVANNALNCIGNGDGLTTPQVLAENIESMLLTYAVTEPTVANSKVVAGYLTADGINNPTDVNLLALAALDRWNKVAAARVCIVVMSEAAVLRETDTNPTYLNCSGTSVDIVDGKMRRAYRTTVLLRNHGVGYVDS